MRNQNPMLTDIVCECGERMEKVMFIEYERDRRNILTGRYRRACSHLVCPYCGNKECVDDTYDEEWRVK